MARQRFVRIELPHDLVIELQAASHETKCSPEQFAAEALESVLAERRLSGVTRRESCARVPGEPEGGY
jgi:hypothetical protein